jgi:hypothetical protein
MQEILLGSFKSDAVKNYIEEYEKLNYLLHYSIITLAKKEKLPKYMLDI